MTSGSRSLLIDFDRRQLRLTTNVVEVYERASSVFAHMLASQAGVNSGTIEILRQDGGFILRGNQPIAVPESELGYVLDLVKDEVRTHFVDARPDLLWLHAGAVERDGTALLIAGDSGQGKSTFTTNLVERGWRYMSDDVAPVSMTSDLVLPFPQLPVKRLYPGRPLDPSNVQSLVRETVQIAPDQVCRSQAMIRRIVYIKFAEGAPATLARLGQGDSALEFLRNATNFLDHKGAAVEKAALVARRLPAFALTYCSIEESMRLLDSL